jgi:hypothetical protein
MPPSICHPLPAVLFATPESVPAYTIDWLTVTLFAPADSPVFAQLPPKSIDLNTPEL